MPASNLFWGTAARISTAGTIFLEDARTILNQMDRENESMRRVAKEKLNACV